MNCTIDASVFVAAVRLEETHHTVSREFLRQAQVQAVNVFCPTLVLPECAAAIVRATDDSVLAEEVVRLIESFPGLRLISLESMLARRAAQIATAQHLRGADAVYAAVAEAFNATLITLDVEMLQRSSATVTAMTPLRWAEEARARS